MPNVLRFGIPSFDKLIGTHGERDYGIRITPNAEDKKIKDATGICIMGPDGTGKSVFALHLASQYLADCLDEKDNDKSEELPEIYYISTDLNHDKALTIWHNFALNRPFVRKVHFEEVRYSSRESLKDVQIKLKKYVPQEVVDYVQLKQEDHRRDKKYKVCFIDLAATTAGDDWGFTHRLLALMQEPEAGRPRHLVIIDAVEGLETYVGEHDAFGETSARRARIAQLARLAVKKAHLLLIVEEMRTMERLPEEFVADIVIRLRNVEANKYLRRTVEIEKTRGQSHVRGQHPLTIRKGKGSTTGSQENVDDPEILSPNLKKADSSITGGRIRVREKESSNKSTYRYQDYVQIFPSLNYLTRSIMEVTHAPRGSQPKNEYAAFGIRYLDNMLGGEGFEAEFKDHTKSESREGIEGESRKRTEGEFYDTRGLPCGSVTALIGDSLTQKTHLGRAFLSRCFYPFTKPASLEFVKGLGNEFVKNDLGKKEKIEDVLGTIRELKEKRENPRNLSDQEETHRKLVDLKNRIANHEKSRELLLRCGVAVLFTTQDTHHEALAKEFLDRLSVKMDGDSDERLVAEILIESRTICRRMEIHDVPASTLLHIFEQNIRKAQELLSQKSLSDYFERFKVSKRVRVVFDDFNAFRNTYHEVREDPLFLPYLPFFLGREGVTALIIDTQSIGRPDLTLTERYESELRELVQYRLYTWRVPFYGDNRVAITAIPPFSPDTSGAIRELRWEGGESAPGSVDDSRSLVVNPHFELYTGLEEGKLKPVPIEVRFYAENRAFKHYLETEEIALSELFVPYKRDEHDDKARVMFSYTPEDYNAMRDFCGQQRGTRLDHTLVFQVDEFWTLQGPKPGRTGAFRPQWNYLTTPTWANAKRDSVADPYSIFQPTKNDQKEAEKKAKKKETFYRLDFYDVKNVPYVKDYIHAATTDPIKTPLKHSLLRVPFAWDFGFLLCKGSAWRDVEDEDIFRAQAVNENKLLAKLNYESSRFHPDDLKDAAALARKLLRAKRGVSQYLSSKSTSKTKALLDQDNESNQPSEPLRRALINELNRRLTDKDLFDEKRFDGVGLTEKTRKVAGSKPRGEKLIRLNRILLEAAYTNELDRSHDYMTVGGLWRSLKRARPETDDAPEATPQPKAATDRSVERKQSPVTWFEFLAACRRVAEHQSYKSSSVSRTFDFSAMGPESLPCLLLEIWASEIINSYRRDDDKDRQDLIRSLSQRGSVSKPDKDGGRESNGSGPSLLQWLEDDKLPDLSSCLKRRAREGKPSPSFSLELYKAWLLVIEAIDFSEMVVTPGSFSVELKPREVSTSVVAARHWYKTACQFIESISKQELEADWVATRLPGNFSVRGDWFLTVAGGSRSSRLADRALDLIGSKRSNITRLHQGVGLPTRKLFDSEENCPLRTRLIGSDGRQLANLPYKHLLKIAGNRDDKFYWLWRSRLDGYNENVRIWERWISRMIVWWHDLRLKYASSWTNGFEMYARIENLRIRRGATVRQRTKECERLLEQLEKLDSWKEFHLRVKELIDSLNQVCVETD